VQVSFSDGRVFEGERGTPLTQFFQIAFPNQDNPAVAAIVGAELRELAWPVLQDLEVRPVFLSDSDGMRIYCRSLSFLLIVAAHEVFPEAHVFIDYSVPYGGYFCRVEGREPLTPEELSRIKARMKQLVNEDHPIERHHVSVVEARRLFSSRGEGEKVRLLQDAKEDYLHLYSLNGLLDYFYGYMVPSTGYLRTFGLEPFPGGVILRFPRREGSAKLLPPQRFTALREVFTEYGQWLDVLGLRDVSSLNDVIHSGRIEEVILVSEALHEKRIAEIAGLLARRHDENHRLIFIAGPSSSGKTTFSKRLAIQLLATGIPPYPIAMDDYFIPRAKLQRGKDRMIDFDSFEALDIPYFEEQLRALLDGKKVTLPRYNFQTGRREAGPSVQLKPNQILLVEGIHGLNPQLLSIFSREESFRIFVSALTQLNLDRHNRVPTTDTRLIRRVVRDAIYRGYGAEATLAIWESVRRGEKQNIFPYQEQADIMFNSALPYELAVLKPCVEPLLLQVRRTPERIEAERLLAFLSWFRPYTAERIPGNSILREFIGGSLLRDFAPRPSFPNTV
jgi:uridine kinase